jgi:hypothetical protein
MGTEEHEELRNCNRQIGGMLGSTIKHPELVLILERPD